MTSSGRRQILQPRSRLSGQQQQQGSSSRNAAYMQSPTQISRRQQAVAFQDMTMEDQQRVNSASIMREENELLVWSSLERNESIPQTRMHYERDMLGIDSDEEADRRARGGYDDDDDSGSVEWEEDNEWDDDDQARMQPGVKFGPSGWWDPKKHASAEERLREEAERRRMAEMIAQTRIKAEDPRLSSQNSPGRRRTSGGTPGKRKSGGKRALGGNAGGSQI